MAKRNLTERAVEQLLTKWEEDIKAFPDTDAGKYAATVVMLCAQELREQVLGYQTLPESGWANA